MVLFTTLPAKDKCSVFDRKSKPIFHKFLLLGFRISSNGRKYQRTFDWEIERYWIQLMGSSSWRFHLACIFASLSCNIYMLNDILVILTTKCYHVWLPLCLQKIHPLPGGRDAINVKKKMIPHNVSQCHSQNPISGLSHLKVRKSSGRKKRRGYWASHGVS